MRSLDDAINQFAYHPATPDTAPRHAAVRDLFANLLPSFWGQVPDGPEKTLAVRKLQEAAMYANLAIALSAPADTSETRGVARVLVAPGRAVVGQVTINADGPTPQEVLDEITHQVKVGGYTRVEAQR